jgi:hypothetical protein
LSDPSRKKIKYFEMKPTEKPSSKIDMLRKENKSLLEMIEANKIQLKQ